MLEKYFMEEKKSSNSCKKSAQSNGFELIDKSILVLFGVLSADGNCIEYTDCIRYCGDWEGEISASQLASLFSTGNKVTFEAFSQWIEKNVEN